MSSALFGGLTGDFLPAQSLDAELVSFPGLLGHPNFTLEVLLIREEEIRHRDETGGRRNGRRRGWATRERRLLEVLSSHVLSDPADAAAFLPAALPQPFTTRELATASGQPLWLGQKMAYCLREMGVLTVVGKRGRSTLFDRSEGAPRNSAPREREPTEGLHARRSEVR